MSALERSTYYNVLGVQDVPSAEWQSFELAGLAKGGFYKCVELARGGYVTIKA